MPAFIFDMDGTLIDSENVFVHLPLRLMEQEKQPWPPELLKKVGHVSEIEMGRLLYSHPDVHLSMPWEDYEPFLWRQMKELYPSPATRPIPGAKEFLDGLARHGIPHCVATATPAEYAVPALAWQKMEGFPLFTPETIGTNKRDPDFYRRVAEKLHTTIEDCIVVEDALYAIRSAKAAGATVWAVHDPWLFQDSAEIERISDVQIPDFCSVPEQFSYIFQ